MPKRDKAYMEGQRELIARAALECMLDKGVYDTTLRDICARAGVSMGALYVHYRTRDDLVLAAWRMEPSRPLTPVSSWANYVATTRQFVQQLRSEDDHTLRRARLSIQFIAEHTMAKENPPGSTELYQLTLAFFRESLRTIHRNEEISLPLGLNATAELHQRLETGTIYMMVADKTVDARHATSTLLNAFAFTAGLKESPKKGRSRKARKE